MGHGGVTLPVAGQPGHGRTAFVRRQPARIVDGRFEGGYTGLFELICPDCGDHPYLDYPEVPSRLQWLRGPRTLHAALAAYDKHLGPLPAPNGDSARSLGPDAAKKVTTYARAPGPASGCGGRDLGNRRLDKEALRTTGQLGVSRLDDDHGEQRADQERYPPAGARALSRTKDTNVLMIDPAR